MIDWGEAVLLILLFYVTISVVFYLVPFLATRLLKPRPEERRASSGPPPTFLVVGACRDSAVCVPGLVASVRRQSYPSSSVKIIILADNCSDNSAQVARDLGVEVYERTNSHEVGKGYALNELLRNRLRSEPFDVLVLFDIDGRVDPFCFKLLETYFDGGARLIQGAHRGKDPLQNEFTIVDDAIFSLLRLHQEGRARLGLPPFLIGSHGIALSREALCKLDWRISTGKTGDDYELGLRSFLSGVPMSYAPDFLVYNDLAKDAGTIRNQRRRYSCSSLRMLPKYFVPIALRSFRKIGGWDMLFGRLLFPAFSTLLLELLGLTALLWGLSMLTKWPVWMAAYCSSLLVGYSAYLAAGLKAQGIPLDARQFGMFAKYLRVRWGALGESFFRLRSKQWWHTLHPVESPIHKSKDIL